MKEEKFVHLCQPDSGKSCGACCGLYNYADSTKESLVRRLKSRTRIFCETVKETADLKVFSDRIFLSLTSRFRTLEELRKGEEIIRENIEEFIACYKMGAVEQS